MAPEPGQRALVIGAGHRLFGRGAGARWASTSSRSKARPPFAARARELGIDIVEGPLEAGWRKGAPYDLILIDGAVGDIPDAIVDQLADGGRLGTALDRPRVHAPRSSGAKSGGAFGYLSLARRRHAGSAGLRPAARHSLSKGSSRVFRKLRHRVADRCADGRHRLAPTRCAMRWFRPISTNPTLTAQREALQGDRRQRRDRQGRRPAAGQRAPSGSTATSRAAASSTPAARGRHSRPESTSAIPLFNGGSVRNSINAAKTRVEAGRATLRAVEGDVFTACGRGLHGRDPRPRDRRTERQQRPRARDQPRSDPRPLRDRRPDPDRRRPVRSPAPARPVAACRCRRAS